MRSHIALLVTIALGLAVGLLLSTMPLAHAVDVQSSVQLGAAATCGLSVTGGSPINYGSLATANAINPEPGVKLSVRNTGTSGALATVKGTTWVGSAPAGTVMDVKTTHFGVIPTGVAAPPVYASKTPLLLTAIDLLPVDQFTGARTPIAPGATQDSFWQVAFVLNAGITYTGTASQTVTLDSTCQ